MSLLVILSSVLFLGWLFFHKPVCSSLPSWILKRSSVYLPGSHSVRLSSQCAVPRSRYTSNSVRWLDSAPVPLHSAFRKPSLGRSYGRQRTTLLVSHLLASLIFIARCPGSWIPQFCIFCPVFWLMKVWETVSFI